MDAHTHSLSNPESIYVLSSAELKAHRRNSQQKFCAGVHPWHVSQGSLSDVIRWAQDENCVGIGETGLDRLHPEWDHQLRIFLTHWDLSEKIQKPLVLHIVRSSSDLLGLMKHRRPRGPWLWHDFTGPLEALPKILKLHPEMYFSCGPRALRRKNFPELWQALPSSQRLLETDDSGVPFEEVLAASGADPRELERNFERLFRVKPAPAQT